MPTKKPRIQSVLEPEIHGKFQYICKKEMRTESQMASYIISKFIEEYETQNGSITTKQVNIESNSGEININQ